jgi:hypothetical protein
LFNDPQLNRLVDDALKENKDLKRAHGHRIRRLHENARESQPAARHHQPGTNAGRRGCWLRCILGIGLLRARAPRHPGCPR